MDTPSAPAIPEPSYEVDNSKQVDEAEKLSRDRQKQKVRALAGHQGTMLTGPLGLGTSAPTQKKTLLGQ